MRSIIWPALLVITALATPEDEIKRLENEIKYAVDVSTKLAESSKEIDTACKRLTADMDNLAKLGAIDQDALKLHKEMVPILSVCTEVGKEYEELNKVTIKVEDEHKGCINALKTQTEQEVKAVCERSREHFVELQRLVGPNSRILQNYENVITNLNTAIVEVNKAITKLSGTNGRVSHGQTNDHSEPEVILRPPVVIVEENKDDFSESTQDESFPFSEFPQVEVSGESAKVETGEKGSKPAETVVDGQVIPPPLPLYIRQTPIPVIPQNPVQLRKTGILEKLVKEDVNPESQDISTEIPAQDVSKPPTGFGSPQSQEPEETMEQELATPTPKEPEVSVDQRPTPPPGQKGTTKKPAPLPKPQSVAGNFMWIYEVLVCNKLAFDNLTEAKDRMDVLNRAEAKIKGEIRESEQIVESVTSNKEALERLLDGAKNVHAEFEKEFEKQYKMLEAIYTQSTEIREKTIRFLSDGTVTTNLESLQSELQTAKTTLETFTNYLNGKFYDAREYAEVTLTKLEAIVQDIKRISTLETEAVQEPESVTAHNHRSMESGPISTASEQETQGTDDGHNSDVYVDAKEDSSMDTGDKNVESTTGNEGDGEPEDSTNSESAQTQEGESSVSDVESASETESSLVSHNAEESTVSQGESEPSSRERLFELQERLRKNEIHAKQVGNQMRELVEKVKVAIERARNFGADSGNPLEMEILDLVEFGDKVDEAEMIAGRELGKVCATSNVSWNKINELGVSNDDVSAKVEEIKKILEENERSVRRFYTEYVNLDKMLQNLNNRVGRIIDGSIPSLHSTFHHLGLPLSSSSGSSTDHSSLSSSSGTSTDHSSSLRGHSQANLKSTSQEASGSFQPDSAMVQLLEDIVVVDGQLRECLTRNATDRMSAVTKYEMTMELYREFVTIFSNVSSPKAARLIGTYITLTNNKEKVEQLNHATIANTDTIKRRIDELLGSLDDCKSKLETARTGESSGDDLQATCKEVFRRAEITLNRFGTDKTIEGYLKNIDKAFEVTRALVGIVRDVIKTDWHGKEPKNLEHEEKPTEQKDKESTKHNDEHKETNDEPTGGTGHVHVEHEEKPTEQKDKESTKHNDEHKETNDEPTGGTGHVHVEHEEKPTEQKDKESTKHNDEHKETNDEPTGGTGHVHVEHEEKPTEQKDKESTKHNDEHKETSSENSKEVNEEKIPDETHEHTVNQSEVPKETKSERDNTESSGFKTVSWMAITLFVMIMQF